MQNYAPGLILFLEILLSKAGIALNCVNKAIVITFARLKAKTDG